MERRLTQPNTNSAPPLGAIILDQYCWGVISISRERGRNQILLMSQIWNTQWNEKYRVDDCLSYPGKLGDFREAIEPIASTRTNKSALSSLSTTSQSAQARPQLGCLRQKSQSSLPRRLGRSGLLALIRGLEVVIGQPSVAPGSKPTKSISCRRCPSRRRVFIQPRELLRSQSRASQ